MRFLKLTVFATLAILLGGCVLTTNQVQLNKPLGAPAKGAHYSKKHVALKVGKITDNRGVKNPNFIVHKRNGFGMSMSGGIVGDQAVATTIQQYLQSGLKKLGYNEDSSQAQYTLTGSLEKTGYHFVPGAFTAKPVLWTKINLRLTNNKTGKQVWHKFILSYGEAERTMILDASSMKTAFNNSLINIVHKVQTSDAFYQAMN